MDNSSTIDNLEKRKTATEEELRELRERLRDLNAKYEKLLIALEVLQDNDAAIEIVFKPVKRTPIRVHVMNMFDVSDVLTVSEVFDRLPDEVETTKATINTTLSELVKAGKLRKRGLGQYCKPALTSTSSIPRRKLLER